MTLAPLLLTAITIIITGVIAVTSIQTEIARIAAYQLSSERRLEKIEVEQDKARNRLFDEVVKERDLLKGQVYAENSLTAGELSPRKNR